MKVAAIFTGFVSLIALSTAFGSFYTVDEGERGVILRNGAVIGTAGPGLHWKVPFIDGVETVSVQDQSRLYENLPSYSFDQQPATITVSVNYRLDPAQVSTIYSTYGGEEGVVSRLIDRKLNEHLKNVFGQYTAVKAVQQRDALNADVRAALADAVFGPVTVVGVSIENIDFSDAYEQSIEDRMKAEVAVQKIRQTAEKEKIEAEITVIKAQAMADSTRANAAADAEATRLRGEAEADAIRAKGEALRDNPALIGLVSAERWDGVLPTTMVPGSAVPFVSVK
jgi:regulator of protease activity HflC (stomatin/prohibitin superfamily)